MQSVLLFLDKNIYDKYRLSIGLTRYAWLESFYRSVSRERGLTC